MAELTSKEPSPDGIFGTKAGSKSCKSESADGSAGSSPLNPTCPKCGPKTTTVWRDGTYSPMFGEPIQRYLCRRCGLRFSDPEGVEAAKKSLQHDISLETIQTKK
ncbi:MAG: hypothetical protein M1167_03755, partial [Chloroflexi bacterium]|nr:hypothetical protein [Chloroflexota bacterium]